MGGVRNSREPWKGILNAGSQFPEPPPALSAKTHVLPEAAALRIHWWALHIDCLRD